MESNQYTFLRSRGCGTIILIHGAWHGAWCWEHVENILRALGYRTIAPDLPGHGRDINDISKQTLNTYVDRIIEIIDQEKEPVILVGHSLGGAIITMVGERRPKRVKKLIYLSAFMLLSGQSCNGTDGSGLTCVGSFYVGDSCTY